MINGVFVYEDRKQNFCLCRIEVKVKETPKSFIFELLDFYDPNGDTPQMADFFRKSKRTVIRKHSCQHAIVVYDEGDFTLYPFRVGVPYWFVPVEESEK